MLASLEELPRRGGQMQSCRDEQYWHVDSDSGGREYAN